jgi:hypothetical protein
MPIFEQMAEMAINIALSQRAQGAHTVAVFINGNGYKIKVRAEYTSGGICCHAMEPAAKRVYPYADER